MPKSGNILAIGKVADFKRERTYKLTGIIENYKGRKQLKFSEIVEYFCEDTYTVKKHIGFQVVEVFDQMQTTDPEHPIDCKQHERETADEIFLYNAVVKTTNAQVRFKKMNVSGSYDSKSSVIFINKGMNSEETVKALIYMLTHHQIAQMKKLGMLSEKNYGLGNTSESLDRVEKVIVDSVACVVCEHFGIDTSSYTFEYINSWLHDESQTVQKVGILIQSTVKDFINVISEKMFTAAGAEQKFKSAV